MRIRHWYISKLKVTSPPSLIIPALRVHSHAPSIRSHRGIQVVWPDFQPMRVQEEPVCVHLVRQKPVFTSLHLKSPVHVHRLSSEFVRSLHTGPWFAASMQLSSQSLRVVAALRWRLVRPASSGLCQTQPITVELTTVTNFSKISPIFEIWLCLCANCKVNCQTQPITVELTTVTNLNAAISCT